MYSLVEVLPPWANDLRPRPETPGRRNRAARSHQWLKGKPGVPHTFATNAPDEPNHAGVSGGKSLWFRWTAPTRQTAIFDTKGSAFDTVLAVYTGSRVDDLALVTANDDAKQGGTASRVAFPAMAGITYHIAVDGFRGASGLAQLNWSEQPAPPNDNVSEAETIGGTLAGARETALSQHASRVSATT